MAGAEEGRAREGAWTGDLSGEWGSRAGTIVVPLDGSLESKVALTVARLIAKPMAASLHVLHVASEPLSRQQLLRQLRLSRRDETLGLIIDAPIGQPSEEILRHAAKERALLIVMTTRGHTPYHGRTLRPVPEQVLYEASCPVVLVRPEIGAQVARMGLHRILLPLDGAPSTLAAIGPAVSLAARSEAELHVLYVAALSSRSAEEPGTLCTPRYVDQPQYEWPAWAQECLDRFCASAGECPAGPATRVFVRRGDPRMEILNFATEQQSDLIVLVWHGRFDPTHAGIVRGVLEEANCPVMLLRAEQS